MSPIPDLVPAAPDARPMVAWRRTSGGYTRYRRVTVRRDYWCIICKRRGAIRTGDATLVRYSDQTGRICLSCEPNANVLVTA